MECTTIFSSGDHRWLAFGADPNKPDNLIDSNQIVVVSGNAAALLDPGGSEVFPEMLAALTQQISVDQISTIFLSHQDPDICSALPLWRRVCSKETKVYVSWLWTSFLAHVDREAKFIDIPDQGSEILVGRVRLRILPAHYLHSPGNFHVYDPAARVLFSGDIGAAILPKGQRDGMYVQDFNRHIQYMETFHRRWLCSAPARDAWIGMVSKLDIDVMAPQHGLMFKGDDVKRFLDWFSHVDVGSGMAGFQQQKA